MDSMSYIYQFLFKGLFVPNAFAPDNPTSDVTVFQPKGVNLLQYDIKIFDSWGHLLWQSQELDAAGCPAESWDGTYNGEPLPMDVYLWRIKATFVDGSVWEGESIGNNENGALQTTGTVTLIR
ncbi:MAG: gliding motility-associated C-terminal domain-containing protein [Bacteroidales bacterium]|nr:gliding motility-associated C-terminal domain-containing protein [Bacteroidales bacterium]